MPRISRRNFLATAAAAAGTGAAPRGPIAALAKDAAKDVPPRPTKGSDLVALGGSGIKTSVLGIGTGTRGGREQREMGQDGFTKLVRHAYDRGVRYIDTADMYKIHPMVREAIKDLPRDELFIQTKTRAKDAKTARADVERFRQELGLETLDTVMMHCMQKGGWPESLKPVMDALTEEKQAGRIRAVGVSCHGFDPLVASVDCDWIDVHLVRINPYGTKMDGTPEQVAPMIAKMHAKGRGVLGMKIFGEGDCDEAAERQRSLDYVLGLGTVNAFTIGFSKTEHIDETLGMIEKSLAKKPKEVLKAA